MDKIIDRCAKKTAEDILIAMLDEACKYKIVSNKRTNVRKKERRIYGNKNCK